jgi:hypothetical protein
MPASSSQNASRLLGLLVLLGLSAGATRGEPEAGASSFEEGEATGAGGVLGSACVSMGAKAAIECLSSTTVESTPAASGRSRTSAASNAVSLVVSCDEDGPWSAGRILPKCAVDSRSCGAPSTETSAGLARE